MADRTKRPGLLVRALAATEDLTRLIDYADPAGRIEHRAAIADWLEAQGMAGFEFAAGDAIIIRSGWEQHWGDPATYGIDFRLDL